MSGGDDPDSCLPGPLKDFVFDLHDSARRSQDQSEQAVLYNGTFREISQKYFASSAWPSPESISSECGGDPLFLCFYRELTLRHLHSVTRPGIDERINGWHVYRSLFDAILSQDEEKSMYVIPEWSFDILHEFVYQFQGFCQFRTQAATNASKNRAAHHEALATLGANRDVWAVETVLFYLHRLASTPTASGARKHLAVFASVVLSRLECLLGDYRASLTALVPLYAPEGADALRLVDSVFQAKLSVVYHAGVSYLMTRRYKDATRVLGGICAFMQRGFKTGQLRKLPGSTDQFQKLFDRMIALLAILTHICPSAKLDDGLLRTIRDKHGNQLSKVESGEEGYEDMFIFACPKFISPALPDYNSSEGGVAPTDAYALQIKQFMNEMSQQRMLHKLRSYMKLYTSIRVDKLAGFNDTESTEFLARLLSYKHKMRQLECKSVSGDAVASANGDAVASPNGDVMGTALDIHFYITGDMIHVGEEEKVRRFEQFFLNGIMANDEIMRDVDTIDTSI